MKRTITLIMRLFCFLIYLCCFNALAMGQKNLEIHCRMDNLDCESIVLASVFGNNQFIEDSSSIAEDGKSFSFNIPDSSIKYGVHYLVFRPTNEYVQILIDRDQSDFSIEADANEIAETIRFKKSKPNTDFYAYIKEMSVLRGNQNDIANAEMSDDEKGKAYNELDQKVRSFQMAEVEKNKGTLLGLIIQNTINAKVPEFRDAANPGMARYEYFKQHYFDHANLSDERVIRTPTFFSKIDDYVQKYTVQQPDSVFASVDKILSLLEGNHDAFKFSTAYFLNKYARTNVMGFDEVYVNIVDAYYKTGKADWIDEEGLAKVIDNADFYRQNFVGDKAPRLRINERNGQYTELLDLEATVTVLLFWSPTCSHCKKELPKLAEFYEPYRDKGVALVTLCTKTAEDCWKYTDDEKLEFNWINGQPASNYYKPYDIRSTPKIYLLDKDKIIRVKNIELERIPKFIDMLLEEQGEQ